MRKRLWLMCLLGLDCEQEGGAGGDEEDAGEGGEVGQYKRISSDLN
jgi:hypothetical protein